MTNEKELWGELDNALSGVNNGKYSTLNDVYSCCDFIRKCMSEIIEFRIKTKKEDLTKKRAGVGVRGMRDILSRENLLGENVKVDGKNFGIFCKCLKDISELPRGGFLWIGGSALSKHTQDLFKRAGENLLNVAEKTAAIKITGAFRRKLDRRKRLAELKERFEMQEIVLKLVSCYEDQKKNVLDTNHNWPLVTNDDTIGLLVGCEDCYDGEFKVSVHLHGTKYEYREIYVYNQKCKNCGDGKDFDGPEIIRKLSEWSNNGQDTIVVEGTEEYQNERKNRAAIKIGKALRGYHDRKKAKRLEWQKEDKEKRELVERLVGYYKNQNSDVANNTLRSWPLVTDYEAIESWGNKKYFDYYKGHFMINREDWEFVGKSDDYRNYTYYIYVYNQKCKNYRTGEDFDGPAIIEKLNEYSGHRKHVIRVDKSKGN